MEENLKRVCQYLERSLYEYKNWQETLYFLVSEYYAKKSVSQKHLTELTGFSKKTLAKKNIRSIIQSGGELRAMKGHATRMQRNNENTVEIKNKSVKVGKIEKELFIKHMEDKFNEFFVYAVNNNFKEPKEFARKHLEKALEGHTRKDLINIEDFY